MITVVWPRPGRGLGRPRRRRRRRRHRRRHHHRRRRVPAWWCHHRCRCRCRCRRHCRLRRRCRRLDFDGFTINFNLRNKKVIKCLSYLQKPSTWRCCRWWGSPCQSRRRRRGRRCSWGRRGTCNFFKKKLGKMLFLSEIFKIYQAGSVGRPPVVSEVGSLLTKKIRFHKSDFICGKLLPSK